MDVVTLAATALSPPSSDSGTLLITVLSLLLGGSLLSTAFQFYKYRKQAGREDDSLVAQATTEAVKAAKEMLSEYRAELERAKDRIEQLTGALQGANDRIARLEDRLARGAMERERLQEELVAAVERRRQVENELSDVRRRLIELEHLVARRDQS